MATAAPTRPARRTLLATRHVRDDDVVWILVGSPRTNTWWRNFRDGAPVVVRLAGSEVRGWAVALDGAEHPEEVAAGLKRYLAVPHGTDIVGTRAAGSRRSSTDTVTELAPHTVMVRVELEPDPAESAVLGA